MSFILEALKKSDQQRQLGTTPTLQAAQVTVAAPRHPLIVYYGLLAAVLLAAGITIGWLRPWQAEQTPSGIEHVAAKAPAPFVQQAAPAPPEMPGKTAQQLPTPKSTPAVQPVPGNVAMKSDTPASTGAASAAAPVPERAMAEKNTPSKTASTTDAVREQQAIPVAELPLTIQQELPAMAVQLHAYSNNPAERLVSINSIRLREGGALAPDLKLEQITPDGMIFSYKGYRFQRGVR